MARHKSPDGSSGLAIPGRAFGAAADADRASAERGPSSLTASQNRFLRGQAHGLKAMLQLGGKGLTDAVVAEVDAALEHHELIKVKVPSDDRDARDAMIADLVKRTDAALVQRIGHVAILYRPSKDHRQIVLPRA